MQESEKKKVRIRKSKNRYEAERMCEKKEREKIRDK